MRNRTGTSNINRRKYIKKASSSQSSSKSSSQPSSPNIVPASTTKSTAGIAVAAPGAAERVQGNRPVSSDIAGREIQVDEEGRMKLDEIENKNFIEQLVRGSVVPTEQMVGVVKDVAYGVSSEDQRTMESGLDLVLNPLMKPFVDERMKTEGVISDEWYWPEELKSTWNVLPGFMQKSDTVEKRSFFDGVSANVGNIGAISQSPLAGAIRDEEFAVSGERFERAPGYYIGSALGEIPYFIIGAGQVKAVGTVAAKATAGVVRGGGVVNTAKMMSTAYKIERATEKLQKVANKLDNTIDQSKIISRPQVLRAVKLLKDGYATNVRVQKKDWKYDMDVKAQVKTVNEKVTGDSKILNKFTAKKMDKIEALPEKTELQRRNKKIKIDAFNADVQEYLLPNMRQFKEGYVAQAVKTASDTKVERLATAIGGSPKNMSKRMDNYFNKRRDDLGDTDKLNEQLLRDTINTKIAQGEYSGVMGNIKFNKDLFGNTLRTTLGINRTQKKAGEIISLVQRSIPNVRVVTKDQFLAGKKSFEDLVIRKEKELKSIEMENTKLEALSARMLKRKDSDISKSSSRTGELSEEAKSFDDLEFYDKPKYDILGEPIDPQPINIKDRIAKNKDDINKINKEIKVAKQTIKANESESLRSLRYTKTKKDVKPDDFRYSFDFEIYQKAYGEKVENIIPKEIIMASKPSVSVKRVKGRWEGQIGDTPETSKTFFIDQIPRAKAQEIYGSEYVSKNPSVFKSIGLRRVGRFRTLVPKKAEPMEDVVYMYEATDALRAAGFSKSGVKPVLVMNENISVKQKSLAKKEYGLGPFTGDQKVGQAISGRGERAIFEYKPIGGKLIEEAKLGKSPKMDGQDVTDILINRAELENRPDEFKFFAEIRIDTLKKDKKKLAKEFYEEQKKIKNNKATKQSTKDKKLKEAEEAHKIKLKTLSNRQDVLSDKMRMKPEELRSTNINLQIHRTADQRGTIFSFPLQVLKKSSESYGVKYERNMVRDIKTDKDYYISQGMDGSSVWYEVTDKAFKPAMVSNTLPGKKEKILLSTKATVNPKDAGPSGNEPFRKLTKDESYIVSIMEKGIKEKWQGTTGKKEFVPGEGWVQPGKWVDANDPDYRMGLENMRLWDEVQPGFYDDIITKGIDEPSEGLKGFIIDKKPSDKGFDGKPVKLKKDKDEVPRINQSTMINRLNDAMRENLIFLDEDKVRIVDGKEVLPFKGMLKKLTPEEKAVLESGSTIGSREARMERALATVKTTDMDMYLAGGKKLSEDEKSLWKRTGKLSTDKDAPYYTLDYGKKGTVQLVKQNVNIVTAKGMLGALRSAGDTKTKLRSKLFGDRFVPLEIKSLAPDASTYGQYIEREVADIPYGTSVRTTGFDDNIAAMFAVSQSDSMVQGVMPGGVKITPVQEALPTTRVIRENPLTAGQANLGKGLDANKGSNYDRMLAQAKGKDANSFGGGTVVRDFKEEMVKQIYTKILKQDKPKPQAMNKYLEPESPQYSELIAKHVETNNSNLKRMSKKEAMKLKAKNKGRKVKKAVINPDDFEYILGKVNLDTRNPIRRLSDAFKYRTQYRTEPEFFKEGTNYTVDGKTSSQYKASKTDKGTNIKQPSWFGKLAIGIGSKRKNKSQFTENTNPFQVQALREVFKEQWVQQYIGKDKTITKLYDDVMGRGETDYEGSLRVTLEGESTSKISRNAELNKLLGRLETTQLRLNKRIGRDKELKPHQKVDRDAKTMTPYNLPKQDIYGNDFNTLTSKQRARERQMDLDLESLGPEKSLELDDLIRGTDKYRNEIIPKLNKAKEKKDVYSKMISTGKMTSTRWDGKTVTRNLDKQDMSNARNNLKLAKDDFDDLTNQLNNPDYLASLKKIKKLEAERKTKTDAIEKRKATKKDQGNVKYKTTKNTLINTNTAPLGPDVNPQWFVDANINAKKIKIVKDEIKEGDIDVARQSDVDDWGMIDRKYIIDDETGYIKKVDPEPRDRWGDSRTDSIGEESQTTFFNVSDDIWKAVGQEDQRLRLGPSAKENVLEPDFSLPEGGAFIEGTKPSATVSPTIKTLGEAKDKTRSVLMTAVGVIEGSSTSASRRSLGKEVVNFMETTFEKSKQKQAKNVINTDNPVDSLSAFLADPKNTSKFDTTAFKKASQKLDTAQVSGQSTSFGSERGVLGMDMGRFRQNIRSDNKQKPVGLKQQAPLASSLATSVGELFKPSETTAPEPEPFELSNPFAVQEAMAQPQPNAIDQAIGDVQKTLEGITTGNQNIGLSSSGMAVKSYEAPSSLTGVIGRMDMSRSDIQTATSQKQPSLLDGLQIGQQQQQPLLESLITTPITDQFLGSMQRQKQSELYKGVFDMLPRGQELRQLAPNTPVTPRPIPQRVMPIVPVFPIYDPVEAAKQRRSKIRKKKTKKTWWQTPENWYEPYYWGGKNQEGAGYVTFTGREPAKVRKYEKRFFGIGVNDAPFGVRSKWF